MNSFVKKDIDGLIIFFETAINETDKLLSEQINKDSILTYYQFPEEKKTPCKQYLIYFSQFLADIGINAELEIKEELHQTLFKVTPQNKSESLDRIKEALEIYLKATNDPEFENQIEIQNDISAMQWGANVHFLKSQLLISKSLLQAKDATIEALQISNFQFKQMIETHDSKKKGSEELIEGFVDVTDVEVKGFKFKLPEILRSLKRRIGK